MSAHSPDNLNPRHPSSGAAPPNGSLPGVRPVPDRVAADPPRDFPPVMTAEEAAAYLRLTENGRDIGDALKTLGYLVGKGLISPCRVGKHCRYLEEELRRFLRDQTERHRARFRTRKSARPPSPATQAQEGDARDDQD